VIDLDIANIGVSPLTEQRVIILKDRVSERYLPIWVGPSEANAVAVKLQGVNIRRPLSHDLLLSVIKSLDARVDSVVINDIRDETFYGEIILKVGDKKMEIDSRPSDALALAVRAGAPIYAEERVIAIAGLTVDEGDENIVESPAERKPVSEDELKGMSAFTDFINNLDMDDFIDDKPG